MIHSILADRATRLFLVLGGFFAANALLAELIGVKLFQHESVEAGHNSELSQPNPITPLKP